MTATSRLRPTSPTSASESAPVPRRARRLRPRGTGAGLPRLGRGRPALAPREVQWFWAEVHRRPPGAGPRTIEDARAPETYDELLARFDECVRRAGRPRWRRPTRPSEAWTWSDDQTRRLHPRRQAHEALIHRLDAEQTAGLASPSTPARRRRRRRGARRDVRRLPAVGDLGAAASRSCGSTSPTPASEFWVQLGRFSGTDPDERRRPTDEEDIHVVDAPADDVEPDVVDQRSGRRARLWLWRRGDGRRHPRRR